MVFTKPVPEDLAFLADALGSVRTENLLPHVNSAFLELTYTSEYRTRVEVEDSRALIRLDVRMLDAICDLVSCIQLTDEASAMSRAFVLFYQTALDLKLSATPPEDDLLTGMCVDYLVSRSTVHVEFPEALSEESGLALSARLAVAEAAGKFALLHELAHYVVHRDAAFRGRMYSELKDLVGRMVRHSEVVTDSYREAWRRLEEDLSNPDPGWARAGEMEELVCDLFAATAITNGARQSPAYRDDPSLLEAAMFATSMFLWCLSAYRQVFKSRDWGRGQQDLARRLVLERASVVLLTVMELRVTGNRLEGETPFLEKLSTLVDRAAIGLVEPSNLERLELIGRASNRFGVMPVRAVLHTAGALNSWH